MRIFAVGLASEQFDPSTLERLAAASGGSYSAATTADLTATFDRLGQEIANEYMVEYRSFAGPRSG